MLDRLRSRRLLQAIREDPPVFQMLHDTDGLVHGILESKRPGGEEAGCHKRHETAAHAVETELLMWGARPASEELLQTLADSTLTQDCLSGSSVKLCR